MSIKNKTIITPVCRISYPYLLKPSKSEDTGSFSYRVNMIFDADADLSELKAAIEQLKQEHWGANQPAYVKTPFRHGVLKSEANPNGYAPLPPEYAGKIIASAASYTTEISPGSNTFDLSKRPDIVGPDLSYITDPSEIYAGMYARVSLKLYVPKNTSRGPSISFGLQNVQKVKDGERLSGGKTDPLQEFKPFVQPAGTVDNSDLLSI